METNRENDGQLSDLIARHADGTLDAEETRELETRLSRDREALEQFVLYMEMHARLAWDMRARDEAKDLAVARTADSSTKDQAKRSRIQSVAIAIHPGRHPYSFLATTVALTLFVWMGWAVWISQVERQPIAKRPVVSAPSTEFCAQLVYSDGAQWGADSASVFDGAFLREDQLLELRQGRAVIQFEQGAQVTLSGPVEFALGGVNQCRLELGKVAAHVPSSAIGFEVKTPTATITDLGTELGLKVDRDSSTEVHVFRGRVEVAQVDGKRVKSRTIVRAGEAIKVGAGQDDAVPIARDESLADISLPVAAAPTGRSIGLNFTAADEPRFTGQLTARTSPGLISAMNWNNVGPRGQRQIDRDLLADVLGPKPGVIVDDKGEAIPGMTANYSYTIAGAHSQSNSLFQGGLGGNDQLADIHVALSGVPYDRYDVYVFVSDSRVRGASRLYTKSVRIGRQSFYFRDTGASGMRPITSTDAAQPTLGGNVAVFRRLSQPALEVDVLGAIHQRAIVICHGIQIVEIPEVSTEAAAEPDAAIAP